MSVPIVVWAIASVGLGLAALGAVAWARLGEYRSAGRRSRRDQEDFLAGDHPMERYRPMARLLGGEDASFLSRNTNCPKVAARWERSRRRIIRLYLRELVADFQYLHAQARALVAQSPEQYSSLLPMLFRQQITFWRLLAMIELRLSLSGLNRKINVEEIVQMMEAMQQEVSRMATTSAA
jgi:hypothetical protein